MAIVPRVGDSDTRISKGKTSAASIDSHAIQRLFFQRSVTCLPWTLAYQTVDQAASQLDQNACPFLI